MVQWLRPCADTEVPAKEPTIVSVGGARGIRWSMIPESVMIVERPKKRRSQRVFFNFCSFLVLLMHFSFTIVLSIIPTKGIQICCPFHDCFQCVGSWWTFTFRCWWNMDTPELYCLHYTLSSRFLAWGEGCISMSSTLTLECDNSTNIWDFGPHIYNPNYNILYPTVKV